MFGTQCFQDPKSAQCYFPQELPEDFDPSAFQGFLQTCFLPQFENFPEEMMPKESFLPGSFGDFDQEEYMQMVDQAFRTFPEDLKQWLPFSVDCMMSGNPEIPDHINSKMAKTNGLFGSGLKIGTLSVEERRVKVLKFLEKRKRRNFKKKISYMCRKKVADKRVRVKGRFVSKVQAEAIRSEIGIDNE